MIHDDVTKWEHFPSFWPFVRGIHRSPVNSPHKGQWRGVLMFSLICAWIKHWVNNREADDLRRHRAHYDVIVMIQSDASNMMTTADTATLDLTLQPPDLFFQNMILFSNIFHYTCNILAVNWSNIMDFSSSPPSAAYVRQLIGSALVQIMACRLFGAKPLSKPNLGYCQLDPQEQT